MNFLVIDPLKEALTYNAIIGQTILCAIQVVAFFYYLKMKFPTSFGVAKFKGIRNKLGAITISC